MKPYHIGIDWGGTRIKIGAIATDGSFLQQAIYNSPKGQEIDVVVEELIQKTRELIKTVGETPAGIGLGLTGPVDPEVGVVYLPGKIKGLENYPIVPKFAESFGIPVTADNDGTVALFAERYCGKAKEMDWATVITIGTGVGSGVIVDGKVIKDPHFLFGSQIGHIVMKSGDEPICLTGARGTGEMYCSATALAMAVRNGLQRGIPSTLTDRFLQDPASIDFKTVIEEGVKQEDMLSCDELRRWTTNVGWMIVNAIHAYSSQIIILSGGATLGSKYFLNQLQAHVAEHTFRYPPDRHIPILISDIQEHAGVLGAAMMSYYRDKETNS